MHRIAHIVHRFLRWLFEPELGGDGRHAVLHLGVQVLEALHGRERIFDLACDLGFHLRRRSTGQRCADDDGGQIDVGELLDLHLAKTHQAQQREHDEQQHRRNRAANRPG